MKAKLQGIHVPAGVIDIIKQLKLTLEKMAQVRTHAMKQ
jgi:hypothetical protein